MNELTRDIIQVTAWVIASFGGVIAAFKAIDEMRKKNEQAKCDLRWAEAKQAKELIDELRADRLAYSALQMLDWSGRSYKVEAGVEVIWFTDISPALRTENLAVSPKEQYIRDCFTAERQKQIPISNRRYARHLKVLTERPGGALRSEICDLQFEIKRSVGRRSAKRGWTR